jgi:hypothetical protein
LQIKRKEQRKNASTFMGVYDVTDGALVGYLLDLTTAGMKLKSLKTIKIGADFELRMDLPEKIEDSTTIAFRARVIWCNKCNESRYYETGLEILDCSPDEAKKMKSILTSDLFSADTQKIHISLGMLQQ